MIYTVCFANNYGQLVDLSGNTFVGKKNQVENVQKFSNLEEAKQVSLDFISTHPNIVAIITPGENDEDELIISSDFL